VVAEMAIVTIKSVDDIAQAVKRLNIQEFTEIYQICTPIPLRHKPQGFATLFQAIIGQQVSVASASAIWTRFEQAGLTTQAYVARAEAEDLASLGLSHLKICYAHALSQSVLDYNGLASLQDEAVLSTLTQITGIGRWTAEVYALQALGRADVFPHGDLALQEATRLVLHLSTRPNEKMMRAMAQDWAPWRTVAAWLLWAYYKRYKSREVIV